MAAISGPVRARAPSPDDISLDEAVVPATGLDMSASSSTRESSSLAFRFDTKCADLCTAIFTELVAQAMRSPPCLDNDHRTIERSLSGTVGQA
jgi:hypothetical protein